MSKIANPRETVSAERGWRFRRTVPSLSEVYRSVQVPADRRNWWGILRKLLAFSGPAVGISAAFAPSRRITGLVAVERL
jgi:hypothetical protein